MRVRPLLVVPIGIASVLILAAAALASTPPSSDVTAPTRAGETVTAEWTGSVPPGANDSGACQSGPTADSHELRMTVPPPEDDEFRVTGTIDIEYSGPLTDLIVTVIAPDGTATSADGGFVDFDEAIGLDNPVAGTYTVVVCMYAGLLPQAYTGRLTLEGAGPAPLATAACPPPTEAPTFASDYVDTTRAGGEPLVQLGPDGALLWGSHAGTTHFFGPAAPSPGTAAFVQNYQGQTYQYFSTDGGATWEFVERTPITGDLSVPGSGFSDPEFAIDAAGNVYISEINLANVAVSKSTDAGRTYTLQNFFGFTSSDRQWMEADEENVLYMTANGFGGGSFPAEPLGNLGHFMAKSTDGGVTFGTAENPNPNGIGDLRIDRRDGTLYEISATAAGEIGVAAFRDIRTRDSDFAAGMEITPVVDGVGLTPIGRLIDPTLEIDAEGNLYLVWTDNGTGARPAGIYYSYSTDRNRTWAPPQRVDVDDRTDIWPWITVGDPGQVAIVFLDIDAVLENNNAELADPEGAWHVAVATTDNGLGCAEGAPGFLVTRATAPDEPVHYGTICQGGTVCQAEAVDRRLGDYFSVETDADGKIVVAVSDTRQGGAVSLPRVLYQAAGPTLTEVPTPVEIGRISGDDRIDTAIAVSVEARGAADQVLLAREDTFPDALAASTLAAALDAPVLLTQTTGLDPRVAAEIRRLGASQVVLLGGPAALAPQVETDLEELGVRTRRVRGPNRFATAAEIAREVVVRGGDVDRVVVALGDRPDGDAWPDAIASGALSAAARAPILLSMPDAVPDETRAALEEQLDAGDRVWIAGGPAAVGPVAEGEIAAAGYDVVRLGGADRYATAVALVDEARAQGAGSDPLFLASGELFADALVAGPAARAMGGTLLLVDPDNLDDSAATRDWLAANADELGRVAVIGGPGTVSDEVVAQLQATLTGAG